MRRGRILLLGWVGVWFLLAATPAWSILIETAPNKPLVAGFLVSDDGKNLVVRIPTESGKSRNETFARAKVKIKHQIDRKRLEKLTRDNPAEYRAYAEQLAMQQADPEAVEYALRLFLIAAYLDPVKQGRDCLLAMSALAPSPADARKYRAMAYLLDGKHDQALLKADAIVQPAIADAAWKSFQQALRKYRAGDVIDARVLATNKGVRSCFQAVPGMMDQDGFIRACTDAICPECKYTNRNRIKCPQCGGKGRDMFTKQPCSQCNGKGVLKCATCGGTGVNRARVNENVDAMLQAELFALDRLVPGASATAKRADAGDWSTALSNPQLTPIPSLTLETITDYDPRRCVYRDGQFVAP